MLIAILYCNRKTLYKKNMETKRVLYSFLINTVARDIVSDRLSTAEVDTSSVFSITNQDQSSQAFPRDR